jgi:purine nucleosidase
VSAPYLLDCDTGIDDAMAILYLLSDPDVELVGVTTTFGNVGVQQTAQNTLRLLALAGRPDVPVFAGAQHPLAAEFDGGAPHVHGSNGIGGVELPPASRPLEPEPAPQALVRLANEHAGRLNVVTTAPLTNVASALALDPQLPSKVAAITVMGGAAAAPGNLSPVAEANIWNDPEAAEIVLTAGWLVTLVPLDVTMANLFEESDRLALAGSNRPVARAVAGMLAHYYAFYEDIVGRPCSALHDPLAAALATGGARAALAPVVRVHVDTTHGPGRGQTIADLRGRYAGYPDQSEANARVVLELEAPFAPLLLGRLLAL